MEKTAMSSTLDGAKKRREVKRWIAFQVATIKKRFAEKMKRAGSSRRL